jgi:VWFA-related protein
MHPLTAIGVLLVTLPTVVTAGQDAPMFSTSSDLVVLHATVKDRRGGYVSGLTQEAFEVLEDGRPQPVTLFTSEDSPVTVGLLIDSSGSMQPNRDRVIAAAAAFADVSHPADELFALGFNDTVNRVLPDDTPFTSDTGVLRNALTQTIRARGRTALFDAIVAGLDHLATGRYDRRVMVVVSDGGDNASRATLDHVIRRTRSSDAVIYTVALTDPAESDSNPRLLKRLAEASGGEAFRPRNADDIAAVLRYIANEIRHTYTLGYVPSNTTRDGAFRQIHLNVHPPDGGRVTVRTRAGYIAGPATSGSGSDGR